ncbi:hypothetical protein [Azotobacter vinelandii]
MADQDIQGMLVRIEATTAQMRQELLRAESAVGKTSTGIDKDLARVDAAFDRAGESAAGMESTVTRALAGVSAVASSALAGLVALTARTAGAADEIKNLAFVSNASVVEFQRQAAAARSVGIEQDKLADIYKDVNDKLGEYIREGGGEMKAFFETIAPKIGVTVDQLKAMSGPQVLQALYNAMEKAGLSQQQMTTYLEEFADEATALIPLLRNGGQGFKDMGDQAERLGQVLSAVDIERLSALNATINQLKGSVQGASNELVMAMLPAIQAVTDDLNQLSTNGAFTVLGEGIGFLIENLDVVTVLLGGTAAAAMTRYTLAVLESGVAIGNKSLATIEATRADLAAAAAAKATAAAAKAAALAELERIRSVQAALAAEKALEAERLRAQITDIGRQQTVARMAELRLAEVAVIKQQEAAERALASATAASQGVASRWTTVGQGMLSLLGGPVGLVALIVSAGIAFLTLRDNTNKSAQALEELSRPLDEVIAKYRQLNQDQQRAAQVKWGEAQAEAAKKAATAYDELLASIKRTLLGPRANAQSVAAYRELTDQLDAAKASGGALGPILETVRGKAGVPDSAIDSWHKQAGAVADANAVQQDAAAKIAAVTAATQAGSTAQTTVNTAVEGYLKTLEDETRKIQDLSEREKALIWLKEQKIAVESEDGKRVLAGAEAADKATKAKEAEKKAEQEATKAKNAAATASKQAAKQLSDYRAETDLAIATASKQAAAYLKGEDAVAQLARQEEIERQVLKLGEQARADVTRRVNEYYDAIEGRDLSRQAYELSREVEQLEAQAVATLAGRDALDEYNDKKALAIALAGKNVDAQSAEAQALEEANRKNREAVRVLEQASRVEGIMDRLLPETKLLREYTEEQDALNTAIERYPAKADQYREALRRLGIEYEQNRTEATAWGQWTKSALERVDSAFADMWKGVGSGFDSFADSLKNAFSQLLAELAHMAITRPIIVQIGSALGIGGLAGQSMGIWGSSGGGSGGSGTGLLGSLSNAYSLYQAGTGEGLLGSVIGGFREGGLSGAWEGLGDYGSGLYNAVASLFSGSSGVNSMAMGATQAGYTGAAYTNWAAQQNLTNMVQGIASWAGPLAGAFAGYQAGGLGGAALGGLGAWGGAAAGTAIGTAIGGTLGSVLPGIGTAIGAAIGSWLGGSLFGGSGERFKETYTTNTGYYSDGTFTGTGKIGWSTGRRQFGDDYDAYLESVNERFSSTLGALSEVFGTGDTVYTHLSAQLRRTSGAIAGDLWTNLGEAVAEQQFHRTARYGEDGENIAGNLEAFANDVLGQWLAEAITESEALPEYLRNQFEDLADDAETTAEQVQERISEIVGRFEGVNSVLELVGLSALEASDAGLQAGDAIIDLAGGLEELQDAVSVYYEQFYSEAERAADTLENVPALFADLGIELPTIRDEYRSMVEDIDVTTAAGQQMFATMMSLAGSADAYYDILESQAAAAEQAAAEAAAALLQAELNYYDLFTDEAQKTEDTLSSVQAQFAALNATLPEARDGFVAAIEALDLTSESGRAMYETLLGLATSADSYYDILEARAAEVQAAAEQAAAEQAALQEAISGEQINLYSQLRDAQISLADALGDTVTAEALRAEILREERDALYESNRAIFDQIQSTNALATAALEAAEAARVAEEEAKALQESIASQQTSLFSQLRDAQIELAEATGDTATAEALRAEILQEERNALYESNWAIFDQILAIDALTTAAIADAQARAAAEEAAAALQETIRARAAGTADAAIAAAQGSLSSLSSVLDAQKSLVAEQYQAQADAIQAAMAEARDSIGEMGSVVSSLRGTLDGLRLESDALDAVSRRQAQGVIQQALASARSGQRVTLTDDLERALDQVSQPSSQLFGSFEDYQRDYWQTYFSIEGLAETAETQLDADERAAATLERQLESAEAYYEAEIGRLDAVLEGAQAQLDALLGIDTSVQSVEAALAVFAGALQQAQALQDANASITSITGLAGVQRQVDSQGYILDEYGNVMSLFGEALRLVGDQVVGGNGSLFNVVDGQMAWASGQAANMEEWARQQGIPGFASGGLFGGGLRLVGEDGPELEVTGPSRIYNASKTAALLGGGADAAAEIRSLRAEVAGLQNSLRAIAKHTMKTAKNTDLLPPVLEQNEAFAL